MKTDRAWLFGWLTVAGLLLVGSMEESPAATSARKLVPAPPVRSAPQVRPVALQTEISAPMFHGTVRAIDRTALRVTILTDFGRLVPVAVESCTTIQRLRIGDHVRLDVDAQGVVRTLEKTGVHLPTAPKTPAASVRPLGLCPETST